MKSIRACPLGDKPAQSFHSSQFKSRECSHRNPGHGLPDDACVKIASFLPPHPAVLHTESLGGAIRRHAISENKVTTAHR